MFDDHWVLLQQRIEVSTFVDLRNELTLCDFAALCDQEAHDSLGYLVNDVFLDNAIVAVDQVLDDSSFHDYSGTFLVLWGTDRTINLIKNDFWQILITLRCRTTEENFLRSSNCVGCSKGLGG